MTFHISDAQLLAAAKAAYYSWFTGGNWDNLSVTTKRNWLTMAYHALKAASQ